MLTEQLVISNITILEDGQIQVRKTRRIFDGTTVIAEQHHRSVLAPGDDLATADPRVQIQATAAWTLDVIKAYQDKKALLTSHRLSGSAI